ncbi:MAG: hypothetical protein K9W43_13200 [Candidatus Thorarchaeota archaeon]|nr:hypothetical protein [Candidatus Thorarchaeota archaeon]
MRIQIKNYDYKVYVTGPFQAGKTTLIHTLDPNTVSIERDLKGGYQGEKCTTTTAFDLGRVTWARKRVSDKGLIIPQREFLAEAEEYIGWIRKEIELRGVPGQLHFKAVRDAMRIHTDGVLLIIDSADPGMIGEALSMLAETQAAFNEEIPIQVIANKQDRESASSPQKVAEWLGVRRTIGMSGKDFHSAEMALTRLLHLIEQPDSEESSVLELYN